MKRLILFAIFLICLYGPCDAQGGMMPGPGTVHSVATGATFVQQSIGTGTNAGGSLAAQFATNVTIGNSIICAIGMTDTDTVFNFNYGVAPLTVGATSTVTGVQTIIYYIHNVSTSSSNVLGFDNDSTRTTSRCVEFSGLKNAAPESTNTNSGLASSTVTTGSVTPISTNNAIFAAGLWTLNDYSSGPINTFIRMTATGGGTVWQETAYKTQTSATASSTGWGLTAGINWAAAIATFGAN